ncbi:hypothetical protein [Paenirhodobacter sp.]|uniref:hypothetical protein n=1 Tax=Paenirhodobacter sp. TaxID=1965326 RepID=UPI003B3D2D51
MQDLALIYVLDPPALVGDSIILLSTIRARMGDVPVIAYVPQEKRAELPPFITAFHAAMGAEIRFMPTEGVFATPYRHGNKILACCQPRDARFTLFLDTDVAVTRAFSRAQMVGEGEVGVVPEGVITWGATLSDWQRVYDRFGMALPNERVTLTRSGRESLPYYNAGVVAFPTGSDFARLWLETALALDADESLPNRRPWLDQIALPVAIRRAGLRDRVLGREWNLSVSPRKGGHSEADVAQLDAADARIVHHHQPVFLCGTRYERIVDAALARATIYPDLATMIAPSRAREAHRAEVWRRFRELKVKPDRTAAETQELKDLGAEKAALKAEMKAPDVARYWPASILRDAERG